MNEFNGNGSTNGNGHGVFGLVAKENPLWTQIVPKARREVCFDTSITEGARMFYCFLTDCSLWPGVNSRPGVVRFANSYLSQKFRVSPKTIQNWKQALITTGRVWTTEKPMKNSFPMTVYNVTAIVGQAMLPMNLDTDDGSLSEDEFLSNRRRKRVLGRDGLGRWVGGSKSVQIPKSADSSELAHLSTPTDKNLPSSTETDCRSQRQSIAVHHGNPLPTWAETDCRGERQSIAVAHGNKLPLPTAIDCRSERKSVADKGEVRDVSFESTEGTLKRSTVLNASKVARGRGPNSENLFLLDVGAMMETWHKGSAKAELANSGGWWRLGFRADADLMHRVLAETLRAVKEHQVKETPGQYAADLWKRWGGKLPKAGGEAQR